MGFCLGQGADKAEWNFGSFSALTTHGSLVGEQSGMGTTAEHREVLVGGKIKVNGGIQAVGGALASDISSHCAMEDCETEGMEFEARGGLEKSLC